MSGNDIIGAILSVVFIWTIMFVLVFLSEYIEDNNNVYSAVSEATEYATKFVIGLFVGGVIVVIIGVFFIFLYTILT